MNYIVEMKMGKTKIKEMKVIKAIFLFLVLVTASACNKDFKEELSTKDTEDYSNLGDGSKRVLYIIMDGVKGRTIENLRPENLTAITNRSLFTFEGLADYQTTAINQAAAWTSMMTGFDPSVSQVVDNSFAGFDAEATPTIFARLKAESSDLRTVSLATSQGFTDHLAFDATHSETIADDEALKNAVLQELNNEDPHLLVAQFSGAEKIAEADGQAYTHAVETLDTYIGEILDALRARKTFKGERWMVVIASSKGRGVSGNPVEGNVYEDLSRNTFIAFYNPNFSSVEYQQPNVNALPYAGSAPQFVYNSVSDRGLAQLNSNTQIGNFGSSGDYTLMYKFKDNLPGGANYPIFFAKRTLDNTSLSAGAWSFLFGSVDMQFDWGGTPRLGTNSQIKNGQWHTIAVTISGTGGNRKLIVYADGKFMKEGVIGTKSTDNSFPITIGTFGDGVKVNFLMRDLVILNHALTENEVIQEMRKEFNMQRPYADKVVGFWPMNESSGDKLYDKSGVGNDFDLNDKVRFATFSDISENISPDISEAAFRAVPNSVDIPISILHWMNINVKKEWNLMGKYFKPTINLPKD